MSDGRGSVTPVVAVVLLVVASAAMAAGGLVERLVAAARADGVADLAALSAATHGPASAGEVAAANGATLVEVDTRGSARVVTVEVAHIRARAAAMLVPEPALPRNCPSPGAPHPGTSPIGSCE